MSTDTWLSRSATRKLALPSSGARNDSTVNTRRSPEGQRSRRHEQPHRDQGHGNRTPIEDDLRQDALRRRHAEIDQQVTEPVREMEEREGDQGEQVELHDR